MGEAVVDAEIEGREAQLRRDPLHAVAAAERLQVAFHAEARRLPDRRRREAEIVRDDPREPRGQQRRADGRHDAHAPRHAPALRGEEIDAGLEIEFVGFQVARRRDVPAEPIDEDRLAQPEIGLRLGRVAVPVARSDDQHDLYL